MQLVTKRNNYSLDPFLIHSRKWKEKNPWQYPQRIFFFFVSVALGGQESDLKDMYPGWENKEEDLNFCGMETTMPRLQWYPLQCRLASGGDQVKNCGLPERKASEVLVSVFPVIFKLLSHSCHIKISWMYHKLLIEGVQLENWKESLSRVFPLGNRWEDRKQHLMVSFVSPSLSFWESSEFAT